MLGPAKYNIRKVQAKNLAYKMLSYIKTKTKEHFVATRNLKLVQKSRVCFFWV
jgi:hypothetical protein